MHTPARLMYTFSEEDGDELAALVLAGELDYTAALMLDERLAVLTERPARRHLLDLRAVTFIDSTAIAAVLRAARRLTARGRQLSVVCEHPNVLRVLEIVGLDLSCRMYRSREQMGLPDPLAGLDSASIAARSPART